LKGIAVGIHVINAGEQDVISTVAIVPVPEPGTLFAGIAVLGSGFAACRRKYSLPGQARP
jgi:hypothetical protein